MKDSNSIELFENDLESMLSQVIAKACSRDKKLNKALLDNKFKEPLPGPLEDKQDLNYFFSRFLQMPIFNNYNENLLLDFLSKNLNFFESNLAKYLLANENYLNTKKLLKNLKDFILKNTTLEKPNVLIDLDTFNYTESIDQLAVNPENKLVESVNHINGNLKTNVVGIDLNFIDDLHLSGKIDDKQYENLKPFTKCFRRLEKSKKGLKIKTIHNYSEVYVYGHSLNKQDYTYFFSVFDNLQLYDLTKTTTFNILFNPFKRSDEENSVLLKDIKNKLVELVKSYANHKKLQPMYLLESLTIQGRINILEVNVPVFVD